MTDNQSTARDGVGELGEKLFVLSDRLHADGFFDRKDHHEIYGAVVASFGALTTTPAQPDDWRTIETAPKDGTVLGYSPHSREIKRISVVQLKDGKPFVVGGAFAFDQPPITHWRPLPSAPTPAVEEGASHD